MGLRALMGLRPLYVCTGTDITQMFQVWASCNCNYVGTGTVYNFNQQKTDSLPTYSTAYWVFTGLRTVLVLK